MQYSRGRGHWRKRPGKWETSAIRTQSSSVARQRRSTTWSPMSPGPENGVQSARSAGGIPKRARESAPGSRDGMRLPRERGRRDPRSRRRGREFAFVVGPSAPAHRSPRRWPRPPTGSPARRPPGGANSPDERPSAPGGCLQVAGPAPVPFVSRSPDSRYSVLETVKRRRASLAPEETHTFSA